MTSNLPVKALEKLLVKIDQLKTPFLFFEPYQLLPVIIGTEAGDWNEQTK